MFNTERLCMGCMNDNGGETVCPICGFDSSSENESDALSIRTLLDNRFLVGKEISRNGEGITYIGWDNETNTVVNIREFYPVGIATRNADKSIALAEGKEYLFNSSLLEFTELSNKLSMANDLPAVLPVVKVFEENATAYSITKAASGIPLTDFLLRNGGTLQWDQARPLFLPLLATLKGLHEIGIVHRGISPDTIMVGRDGRLKLSCPSIKDIRTTGSELQRELFPGYSAVEQYGFDNDSRDGTWTDVYALAATLFRVLVGNCPPEANSRITDDNMSISAKVADSLPKHVLVALANALQILPSDRTQTIDELRRDLIKAPRGTRIDLTAAAADAAKAVKSQETVRKKKNKSSLTYVLIAVLGTAVVFIALFSILASTVFKDLFATDDVSSTSSVLSVPSQVSVNTEDTYTSKEKTYVVPSIVGKSFAEILNEEDYKDIFIFEIAGKSYSDKYKRGTIISQSVEAGTHVKKETTITVNVSLGPKTVKIPKNLRGKTMTEAKIALLELGFLSENIKFEKKYDETLDADLIINTEPEQGSSVYPDSAIVVYYNFINEETEADASDESTSESQTESESESE